MIGVIRLEVMPDAGHVVPGGSATFAIMARNAGQTTDQYQIGVSGLPEDWYTVDRTSVTLLPAQSDTVTLIVRPPIAAAPGEYLFSVQAVSGGDTTARASQPVTVTIATAADLGMDVNPVTAQGREAAYRVSFANAGDRQVAVSLDARDDEGGLDFTPEPAGVVTVPPGGQASIRVLVRPHTRETIGEPHPYAIEFRGLRNDAPAAAGDSLLVRRARFTYEPRFTAVVLPLWLRRLPLWALVVLPLLLLALVFVAGNRVAAAVNTSSPATATRVAQVVPTITTVPTVNFGTPSATAPAPTQVPALPSIGAFSLVPSQKGAVLARWDVGGADTVSLNGRTVPAHGTQGVVVGRDHTLVLTATSQAGSVTKVLKVVPPPIKPVHIVQKRTLTLPTIQQFTAQPSAGGLRLVWRVVDADTVRVDGKAVGATGSQPLPAGQTGGHALQATNVVGTIQATLNIPKPQTVVHTVVIRQPSITRFTVTQPQPGQPYVIEWQTVDATSVTLNGRPVSPNGSQPLPAPIQPQTYALVARNADGVTQSQLQVTVQ